MSHRPQRKESNCLNCGTEVFGRYCHVCGQENIEPRDSFLGLVQHFFADLTHWDGKFFSTIKLIVTKPGFLTKEFMNGRRVSYLHPIKLYVFTSAIFFIILFSTNDFTKNLQDGLSFDEARKMDSTELATITKGLYKKSMTREELMRQLDSSKGIQIMGSQNYRSREAYDSAIRSGTEQDGWISRQITYKVIDLNKKYKNNSKEVLIAIITKFFHLLPQMMFILLPLFALVLKLLYIRRKKFYYVDHIIFTLHLYVFFFIAMLVIEVFSQLHDLTKWDVWRYITIGVILGMFFYLYKALRNFYKQRRFKTIVKFNLLLVLLLFITVGLFFSTFIFSMFQV